MIDGRERTLVIVRDVTRQKVKQRQLDHLLETVRELLIVETESQIIEIVERIVASEFRFSDADLFVLDREAGGFRPAEGEDGAMDDHNGSTHPGDVEPLWDAIDSGEVVFCDDADQPINITEGQDFARSNGLGVAPPGRWVLDQSNRLYFPLGDFGVIRGIVGPGTDRYDVELVTLLATFAAGAFDRSQREHQLREREFELREHRDALLALNHVNSVIRDINQALVSVSSREGIEQLVCEKFVSSEPYQFAWLGPYESGEEAVRPTISAGRNEGYFPTEIPIDRSADDAITKAVIERSVVIVGRITPDTVTPDQYRMARERGFRSVAFVPVVHENVLYRILAVYANELDAFSDQERTILGELGETIGLALAAAEWRTASLSETVVHLDLAVTRTGGLFELCSSAEQRLSITDLQETEDGTIRAFGQLVGTTYEAFKAAVNGADTLADPVHLAERDGGHRVAFTIRSGGLLEAATAGGVSVHQGTITEGRGRYELVVASGTDVRRIVDRFEEDFDSVELLSQQNRERANPLSHSENLITTLTDRQQDVLQTAYHAGYFATPRESTGTDVASLLGVTQPTFNEHLRNAERQVFDRLLNPEPIPFKAQSDDPK